MQIQQAPRHLCSELVSVVRMSGRRRLRALDGNLEEIGERSAVILVQRPLPNGMRVRVKGKGHELLGYVRSCTVDRVLGFFINIELQRQSRWSEKWFVPQHLLKVTASSDFSSGISLSQRLRFLRKSFRPLQDKFTHLRPAVLF